MPTINTQQPMRPAEVDLVAQVDANTVDIATQTAAVTQEAIDRNNADVALGNRITEVTSRFPVVTADIADLAVTTSKIADAQVTTQKVADNAVTSAKLDATLRTLINSFPTLTYGENSATSVPANSNVLVDVTFPNALTEAPNVYCMARSTVCVECNVEQVTNQQVSIRLYNNTTSDAESVSIDWLAISGR